MGGGRGKHRSFPFPLPSLLGLQGPCGGGLARQSRLHSRAPESSRDLAERQTRLSNPGRSPGLSPPHPLSSSDPPGGPEHAAGIPTLQRLADEQLPPNAKDDGLSLFFSRGRKTKILGRPFGSRVCTCSRILVSCSKCTIWCLGCERGRKGEPEGQAGLLRAQGQDCTPAARARAREKELARAVGWSAPPPSTHLGSFPHALRVCRCSPWNQQRRMRSSMSAHRVNTDKSSPLSPPGARPPQCPGRSWTSQPVEAREALGRPLGFLVQGLSRAAGRPNPEAQYRVRPRPRRPGLAEGAFAVGGARYRRPLGGQAALFQRRAAFQLLVSSQPTGQRLCML